jgi:hypothetical protein
MKCRAGRRPFVDTYEEHNQQHFAYLATTEEIWDDSRGGIDMGHQDRLDRPSLIFPQPGLDFGRADGATPISLKGLHVGAEKSRCIAPSHCKPTAFQHQNLITPRQHIGKRRLPGAMAVGDVDVRASVCAEQPRLKSAKRLSVSARSGPA